MTGRLIARLTDSEILFRTDGARIWGLSFGHVYRCLALAREIRHRDIGKAGFVMKDHAAGIDLVAAEGFPVRVIPVDSGADEERAAIHDAGADAVVFDLPEVDGRNVAAARADGAFTVVIDEASGQPVAADAIINGSIVAAPGGYGACPPHTRRLMGPEYCVMDSIFDNRRRADTANAVRSVLVTFGGSDPAGLSVGICRALGAIAGDIRVDLVLGPGADELVGLEGDTVTIHRAVPDLCAMMLDCDIAIAAGGRTAYELAATGTPAILVPSHEREIAVTRAFAAAGAALETGPWDQGGEARFAGLFGRMVGDADLRETMRRNGLATVDGGGRDRVVGLLDDALGRARAAVPAREAGP